MADGRQYTITIYDKTTGQGSPIAGEQNDGKDTKNDDSAPDKGEVAFNWMSLKRVANYAKRAISYEISTVSLRTGENERQQRMQFAYDILGQTSSAITNIVIGAKVGGAYGAIAAAAYTVVETSISIGQKIDRFNLQKNLENVSLGLARTRSGDSLAYINGGR
jgi:hypothetical protein